MTLLSSLVCGLLWVIAGICFEAGEKANDDRARARRRRQIDPWTLRKD